MEKLAKPLGQMAKKYNPYYVSEEEDETKQETEATIILSESFR